MTDARLPERYLSDRRLLRLPPRAFRTYAMALLWSVSNRTDGLVEVDDLALIPCCDPQDAPTLEDARLWRPEGRGWCIVDFTSTQTSSHELTVLENARRREREKKAKQRAQKTDGEPEEGDSPPGQSPGTVPGDNTGEDRRGEARPRNHRPTQRL